MIQEHDVVITRKAFPADFVWGAATAAYQIEGAV
ncbi:MAG TPA: family 1 glycosylhydrolase [Ktedonobacteraceae bacterium]|nr:family 1 glycosylhydrolase [Ktedonobacteraceae bacterium]